MGVQTTFGMDKLSLLDSETKKPAEYESLRTMSSPGCSNVCSSDSWWEEVRLWLFTSGCTEHNQTNQITTEEEKENLPFNSYTTLLISHAVWNYHTSNKQRSWLLITSYRFANWSNDSTSLISSYLCKPGPGLLVCSHKALSSDRNLSFTQHPHSFSPQLRSSGTFGNKTHSSVYSQHMAKCLPSQQISPSQTTSPIHWKNQQQHPTNPNKTKTSSSKLTTLNQNAIPRQFK